VGGATVSTKHCGFVVNTDNATAKDVYTLIKDIQLKVKETSGVMIEPEVILVGEF
jgi:UDP-N-acetylmuramate dehydrogenase